MSPRSWGDSNSRERRPDKERSGGGSFRPPQRRDVDEQVLRVRETGASYSAIARNVEMRRASDAHSAFVRAVNKREGEERQQLIDRESARLDLLEVRIRERDAGHPEKVERRLAAVATLREALS